MRGKPEKSFKRITEALTEKFPQPLGMLDDMLTQIEELMGKHYSQYLADMQAVFQKVWKGSKLRCCMQRLRKQAVNASPAALAPQSPKPKNPNNSV